MFFRCVPTEYGLDTSALDAKHSSNAEIEKSVQNKDCSASGAWSGYRYSNGDEEEIEPSGEESLRVLDLVSEDAADEVPSAAVPDVDMRSRCENICVFFARIIGRCCCAVVRTMRTMILSKSLRK